MKTINNHGSPIAYFCMEYAIDDDSNAYAGGLGILAMDYLLEAADQGVPIVAIGLRYSHDPSELVSKDFSVLKDEKSEIFIIEIPVGDEIVKAKVWHRRFKDSVDLMLLDTHTSENLQNDLNITSYLYDSDFYTRIKQQIILGIGGVRLLNTLNIKPRVYHLNEGHTAFAGLAIIAEKKAKNKNEKIKVVATKHTIFHDAGMFIKKEDFHKYVAPYCKIMGIDSNEIYKKGEFELDSDTFSTTRFLMNTSDIQNGVSVLHTVYEKKVHPHSKLIPVTNGVYKKRWQAREWKGNPIDLSNKDFWDTKNILRAKLVSFVKEKTDESLDPQVCTIVWSRRFAEYKRPFLLFSDLERLKNIVSNKDRPMQFIISGKAHLADAPEQEIIKKVKEISQSADFKGKVVYVPNYSLNVARSLVQGADVWLNTPIRGKEACGTSGIKASFNGALQCSVSDGWVDEVSWENKGWMLSEDNTKEDMYSYLENDIPDLFYNRSSEDIPAKWIANMKSTIDIVEFGYTTARMLRDYLDKIY
ncbi:MAG TPA: alpha-glucan family phosphorylase [Candidatus Paceibacterota bacterium]